jgi:3-hydroxyisobutyrate dehydrogenase-like beta-hydroxyacid dehydrogenase
MCGGAESDFARAEPILAVYAKSCRLMGGAGAGQLTKATPRNKCFNLELRADGALWCNSTRD